MTKDPQTSPTARLGDKLNPQAQNTGGVGTNHSQSLDSGDVSNSAERGRRKAAELLTVLRAGTPSPHTSPTRPRKPRQAGTVTAGARMYFCRVQLACACRGTNHGVMRSGAIWAYKLTFVSPVAPETNIPKSPFMTKPRTGTRRVGARLVRTGTLQTLRSSR